jgi:hypothetical protein
MEKGLEKEFKLDQSYLESQAPMGNTAFTS